MGYTNRDICGDGEEIPPQKKTPYGLPESFIVAGKLRKDASGGGCLFVAAFTRSAGEAVPCNAYAACLQQRRAVAEVCPIVTQNDVTFQLSSGSARNAGPGLS
jgi:hypothetical protein